MNRQQILALIQQLALSQGFYGRLLRDISNMSDEEREEFWTKLENQHFKDSVDFVNFIEGA